jgi:hypothetical protein
MNMQEEFTKFTQAHITSADRCVALGQLNPDTQSIETAASGDPDLLADMAIGLLRHTKQLDVPSMMHSLAKLYASIGSDHMRVQINVDGTWRDVADGDTLRALL